VPGYFSPIQPDTTNKICSPCLPNTYTDVKDSEECKACQWPSYAINKGSIDCPNFSLHSNRNLANYIYLTILFLYIGGVAAIGPKNRAQTLSHMLPPALDFTSDVAYLLEANFYLPIIFYFAFTFLFLCNGFFFYQLYERGLGPAFLKKRFMIGFPGYYYFNSLWFLGIKKGTWFTLTVNDKQYGFYFDNNDNLLFVTILLGQSIYLLALQILMIMLYLIWILFHFVLPLLWIVIGMVLFQTKVICVNHIWNGWIGIWTGTDEFAKNTKKYDVDGSLLNESIFTEFTFETVPQLTIQGINNSFTGEWSNFLTISSFLASTLIIFNTAWRYFYHIAFNGLTISSVPTGLVEIKQHRRSTVRRRKTKNNKVVPDLESGIGSSSKNNNNTGLSVSGLNINNTPGPAPAPGGTSSKSKTRIVPYNDDIKNLDLDITDKLNSSDDDNSSSSGFETDSDDDDVLSSVSYFTLFKELASTAVTSGLGIETGISGGSSKGVSRRRSSVVFIQNTNPSNFAQDFDSLVANMHARTVSSEVISSALLNHNIQYYKRCISELHEKNSLEIERLSRDNDVGIAATDADADEIRVAGNTPTPSTMKKN
jgi:hypothetical protein